MHLLQKEPRVNKVFRRNLQNLPRMFNPCFKKFIIMKLFAIRNPGEYYNAFINIEHDYESSSAEIDHLYQIVINASIVRAYAGIQWRWTDKWDGPKKIKCFTIEPIIKLKLFI